MKKGEPTEEVFTYKKTLAQEFFYFLKTFGIIGLAIAFVIGQAASGLVTSFVDDIINPLIGLFFTFWQSRCGVCTGTDISGGSTELELDILYQVLLIS